MRAPGIVTAAHPQSASAELRAFYEHECLPLVVFLYKQGASWESAWNIAQLTFIAVGQTWSEITDRRAWIRVTAVTLHETVRRDGLGEPLPPLLAAASPAPDFY